MFREMGKFGGNLFLRGHKAIFEEQKSFAREMQKIPISAHNNILDKSQSLYQLTSFFVSCQAMILL